MNSKREILQKMKSKQGDDTIIIFRNGGLYEAYYEDAEMLSSVLCIPTIDDNGIPTIRIHKDNQIHSFNKILDSGCSLCISSMRDSSGEFAPIISEGQENLHLYNDEE